MYSVQNKTAMITGGAGGLGYKYAEILLRNGAKTVAIVDLPTSNGQNAVTTWETEFGKGRAVFFACDVTKVEDFQTTFKKIIDAFKQLDILINNAGIIYEQRWEQTIDINIKAVIRGSLLAMDHMGKHKGGKGGVIVNISSLLGIFTIACVPIYTATKHAIVGFSRSVAQSYDKTGVRVVIMCPGVTHSEIGKNMEYTLDFVHDDSLNNDLNSVTPQSADHVALAMLDLIQKGENGTSWGVELGQPPYAIDFPAKTKYSV